MHAFKNDQHRIMVFTGHTKWITAVAWEPAHMALPCRRFVSGSKDTTVKVCSMTLFLMLPDSCF